MNLVKQQWIELVALREEVAIRERLLLLENMLRRLEEGASLQTRKESQCRSLLVS